MKISSNSQTEKKSTMDFFEVYEIGRESVKSVNASILATLIKELVNKFEQNHKSKLQHYKYQIKCKEKLELVPKKYKKIGDDEGFESDINEEDSLSGDISNEDAQSTTSSCCLVEDHVFKSSKTSSELIHRLGLGRNPISTSSIVGSTDSANSSGSSDTDELDIHSLTPSPIDRNEKISKKEYSTKRTETRSKREEFPIGDVIFCHTEPKYPTVIAWVIKRHSSEFDVSSRLGKTGVESIAKNENCLEVIVIKCRNSDNLRELCANYQEFSKRIKLDQYKSINRRRDADQKSVSLAALIESKDVKVSLSDMKVSNSNLIKSSELSILNPKIMTSFKTDLKNSVSLNSLLKPEVNLSQKFNKTSHETKLTVYQPKDDKKAQSTATKVNREYKSETISRTTKSYKEPSDQFNLVQRTDLNGVTHLEVSKGDSKSTDKFANKSKIRKEIEGVILTDVDSYVKKDQVRQRQNPIIVNDKDKVWRQEDSVDETPPIRPERRKYVKKKTAPSPPTETKVNHTSANSPLPGIPDKSKSTFYLSVQDDDVDNERGQKIVKGQYIRVQSWGNQNVCEPNLGSWKGEPKERLSRKSEDKYVDRRRSRSVGKFGKKTPMAYRYIDITDDNQYQPNPSRLYGISQKIREISGNVVNNANTRRRRNSFDDIINFDNRSKGNLKSVIKKNNKMNDKYCEPKKVTFSAFATVQVVD